jgi:hypothetical protein
MTQLAAKWNAAYVVNANGQIQAEQERRKLDAEKCVTGAETAVLEWIHQQFASLRSTLTIQQSIGGTGLYWKT